MHFELSLQIISHITDNLGYNLSIYLTIDHPHVDCFMITKGAESYFISAFGKYDGKKKQKKPLHLLWPSDDIDGLVQQRCNSIANTLEWRLSCINPSIYGTSELGHHLLR